MIQLLLILVELIERIDCRGIIMIVNGPVKDRSCVGHVDCVRGSTVQGGAEIGRYKLREFRRLYKV